MQLLDTDAVRAVVADVSWDRFRPLYESARPAPLLSMLSGAEARPASRPLEASSSDFRLRLSLESDSYGFLLDRLTAEVTEVMGVTPDAQQGFFQTGMDSLMSVEFKTRIERLLGVSLPSTVVFNYPSLDALTRHLLTLVESGTGEPRTATGRTTAPVAAADAREPIAIVGMSCRVPGADDPEGYWQLLADGTDAIVEIPPERWDVDDWFAPEPAPGRMYTRCGGFLRNVDRFDPLFFGISPREAVGMDPQQRLLLEVGWEALERAGEARDRTASARTGVFVGITTRDYAELIAAAGHPADAYAGTGNVLNVAAGRLSYALGLTGPSLAVDTACSSSLVTVHLAVQALRHGECDLALAGGVNLVLSPTGHVGLSQARMLAPDGRCKTFDARADGYARGEGCGIVVLKRLSDARRDGNRVLAVIRGTAVNHDGASSGLTVPNGLSQQALIRQALDDAGVAPDEVTYVEAHGTGTSLGDPIELEALGQVFGRPDDRPLIVGSVKTNIGHLESAAGVAGLMKIVLSLQHRQIPAHLHFETPNPHVDWTTLGIRVPTRLESMAGRCERRGGHQLVRGERHQRAHRHRRGRRIIDGAGRPLAAARPRPDAECEDAHGVAAARRSDAGLPRRHRRRVRGRLLHG